MKEQADLQIKVSGLKQLLTLIIMQLRARIELSFFRSGRDTALKFGKTALIFGFATGGVYACFFIVKTMLSLRIDLYFLSVLLAIMLIGSFFACLGQMTKSLYESRDRIVLLTFPVRQNMVFFSKIIVSYIQELSKNLTFFGSVIIAFGIVNKLGVPYYLSSVWIYCLLSLVTVCFCAVVSIPYLYIRKIIRKSTVLKFLLLFAFIGIFACAIHYFSAMVPEKLYIVGQWSTISKAILTLFQSFSEKTWIFLVFAKGLLLEDYGLNIAIILGITVGCLLLSLLITRPLFLRLTSISLDEKAAKEKKARKIKKEKHKNGLVTLLSKELKLLYKNFNFMLSTYFLVLLSPFLIYLLNTVYAAMAINGFGRALQYGFNLMIITILACTSSTSCATAFSNEGGNISMLQSEPVNPIHVGFSKVLPCIVINTVMIIACWVTVASKLHALPYQYVLLAWSSALISATHIFWSLDMDLLRPEFSKGRDEGNKSQNTNAIKSLFAGIALCFLLGLVATLIAKENFEFAWIFLFLLSALLFAARLCLCIYRLKVYLKRI